MSLAIVGFFFVFLVLRIPIAIALALSSVAYLFFFMSVPMSIVSQQMISSIDKFTLMAIPFFIVAGGLMETGGISERIINFSRALVGPLPGGMALVMVVSTMLFSGMTGSGVADAAAIGSVLIPAMARSGYDLRFSAALQATSGVLGPLIPPSILAVLYGVAVGVSIGDMLLAGIVPGLVMALFIMGTAVVISVKRGYKSDGEFSFAALWKATREAFWALLTPIIIMGGIYTGIFTPTEAAAVACLYSIIVGVFIYKELKMKDILMVLYRSGILAASVMIIVATSAAFSWIVTREGLPQMLADWFLGLSSNPYVFLFAVSILLLIVGCFLDGAPAVLILAPILAPVAVSFGIDPVHFGIVMVCCMSIGLITPPVGLNLFVVSTITKEPVHKILTEMGPFLIASILALIIIIAFPYLTLVVPQMMR